MSETDAINVLQITDLHLFAEADVVLKGVHTRGTFDAVLKHVTNCGVEFDLVIVTGDLTHDEERDTYRAVRDRLEHQLDRCRILPGNHDDRAVMREVFPDVVPADGPISFSSDVGNWRLIGLDSHSPGEVAGRMDDAQVAWLDGELSQSPGRDVGVFLHHPPVPLGIPWMDRIALQDPEPLLEVLSRHTHVRFICTGHVHHESEGMIGDAVFLTTPSTSVQFVPAGDEPAFDTKPSGYRTFRLSPGKFETQVHRVD